MKKNGYIGHISNFRGRYEFAQISIKESTNRKVKILLLYNLKTRENVNTIFQNSVGDLEYNQR
jgi:ribosomal protein S8